MALPRLRQVVVVAGELQPASERIEKGLGLGPPYHDPDVDPFGLENAVYAVGDAFVEVVTPTRSDAAAARFLARRGDDGAYMAIFQVEDLDAARRRTADLGLRIVWEIELPDIAALHLHPKDLGAVLVSLDRSRPADAWRWAGPAWTGWAPEHPGGGIVGMDVRTRAPGQLASRWAQLLGVAVSEPEGTPTIGLDAGRQAVRFLPADHRGEGVFDVSLAAPGFDCETFEIGQLQFHVAEPATG